MTFKLNIHKKKGIRDMVLEWIFIGGALAALLGIVLVTATIVISACRELFNRHRNCDEIDFYPKDVMMDIAKKNPRLKGLYNALCDAKTETGFFLAKEHSGEVNTYTTSSELDSDISHSGHTVYRSQPDRLFCRD